jgi:hypothetical protein
MQAFWPNMPKINGFFGLLSQTAGLKGLYVCAMHAPQDLQEYNFYQQVE